MENPYNKSTSQKSSIRRPVAIILTTHWDLSVPQNRDTLIEIGNLQDPHSLQFQSFLSTYSHTKNIFAELIDYCLLDQEKSSRKEIKAKKDDLNISLSKIARAVGQRYPVDLERYSLLKGDEKEKHIDKLRAKIKNQVRIFKKALHENNEDIICGGELNNIFNDRRKFQMFLRLIFQYASESQLRQIKNTIKEKVDIITNVGVDSEDPTVIMQQFVQICVSFDHTMYKKIVVHVNPPSPFNSRKKSDTKSDKKASLANERLIDTAFKDYILHSAFFWCQELLLLKKNRNKLESIKLNTNDSRVDSIVKSRSILGHLLKQNLSNPTKEAIRNIYSYSIEGIRMPTQATFAIYDNIKTFLNMTD